MSIDAFDIPAGSVLMRNESIPSGTSNALIILSASES